MFRKLTMAAAIGVLAAAAVAVPASAGVDEGTLWVVHGIPGTKVDVCLKRQALLTDFKYGRKAKMVATAGVDLTIRVRRDAHETCKGAVLIKQTVNLDPGANLTAVANVVDQGGPVLSIYENDTTEVGAPSSITVIHEATAPVVDIWLARTIRFGTAAQPTLSSVARDDKAGPVGLEPDAYALWASVVLESGSDPTDPIIGPKLRDFQPGRAYTVIAVGDDLDNYRFVVFNQPID